MTPIRLVGLDIETDTTVDGLDPEVSPIVAVALVAESERHVITGDEVDILRRTEAVLAGMAPSVLVTWNGARFDLPFLDARARRLGVEIGLRFVRPMLWNREDRDGPAPRAVWGRHGHLDAYRVYRADVGRTLGIPCALKPLARFLGYEPIEVDRTRIEDLGEEELIAYVASDAELTRLIALRRAPAILRHVDRPNLFRHRG